MRLAIFFFNNTAEIFVLRFFKIALNSGKLSMQNKFTLCFFYVFIFQVFKPIVEKFNFTFNCDIKRR